MAKRILLVEDEPNIVTSLTFLLKRAGLEVSVETKGSQVLDAVLKDRPDLLILDVMLPELSGYEVLRQLRAERRAAGLPVLMLTAKGQSTDRETALESGADMFITKPFANSELVAAVHSLLERNGE
ncbi:MAG: response regulator [Rhodospirillales bacterium]